MLGETVYRSDDVPVADRFDAWRELMSKTHAPMDLTSEHDVDFTAQVRHIELGEVSIWPATFRPLVWRRTPKHIRQSDPDTFHISLVLQGTGGADWGREQLSYVESDLHNNHSSRTYELWSESDTVMRIIGVEIPRRVLPMPGDRAEQVIGRPMSGREGVGALLAQFLTRVAADVDTYRPEDAPRLGMVLTDLVAALFAHTLEAQSTLPPHTRRQTLLLQTKDFIRRNLHDSGLTPHTVAAAHHISVSYLHRVFREEGTTVAAWIRARRMERICHDLAAPELMALPIHAVAARWGFPRPSEFSRAFRAAHGISPRDYRQQAALAGTDVLGLGSTTPGPEDLSPTAPPAPSGGR